MRWPVPSTFRVQIAVVIAASAAMLALAVILIRDVVGSAEGRLRDEALQQCAAASRELAQQYEERSAFVGDPLDVLPLPAQDISLKGLSSTVLRSYEGVEGGFYLSATNEIIGYSSPTVAGGGKLALLGDEQMLIRLTAGEASGSAPAARHTEWNRDLGVAAARRVGPVIAWSFKRLAGARDPVGERRRWMLAALVLSAMLGLGGLVSAWYYLHSGVHAIRAGLQRLEADFGFRLPPVPGDFGRIAGAINQMAERRSALEGELRRQDRLAALGKAVAGVAHEIRNPLNSMKLTLELLGRRLRRGQADAGEVSGAIQEIDRLDLIVTRLLAFGRPALVDRRRQPITPVIERAVAMVQERAVQKGVRIEVDSPPLAADIDGAQMQQVLINLLLNAVDASPTRAAVEVSAAMQDSKLCVVVRDSGPGIPADARPHLFDAYFTTKPEGVGLGLSVSREIAVNHGGVLEFETSERGTEFRLLLPLERIPAGETQSADTRGRG